MHIRRISFPTSCPSEGNDIRSCPLIFLLVCIGAAYLLLFHLIDEIGAAPALIVIFLIPLLGTLFGGIFLDEHVGWHTLAGGAVVIAGTVLVTGFSPRLLGLRKEAANG